MAIWKKLTSVFMSVALVVGLCPSMAFAQGGVQAVDSQALQVGADNLSAEAAIPAAIDYDGDVEEFFKEDLTSAFGMYSRQDGSWIKYENGKIVIEHITSNKTIYAGFYLNANKDDSSTWDESRFYAANDDGWLSLEIDPSYAGKAWPIAPVKNSDRTATTSAQFYFAIPALDKIPGYEAPSPDPVVYDLTPANTEKMFVVVKVVLEDYPGTHDYLTYYLNSGSYGYAFSGGQDDAVASWDFDAKAPKADDARWAAKASEEIDYAYTTWDGKAQSGKASKSGYRIPVTVPEGETQFSLPVVAYASDFTARSFKMDLGEKTVVPGSASDVASLNVSSSVADVTVSDKGSVSYTGYVRPYAGNQNASSNPLSNDFVGKLALNLGAGSVYDQAYAVTYEGQPYATAKVSDPLDSDYATVGTDGTLELPFYNEYDTTPKTVQLNGNKITVMMHVVDSAPYKEAGTWVERTFQLDFSSRTAGTLAISGAPLTATTEYVVNVDVQKKDGSTYSMFVPTYDGNQNKALVTVADDGTATISFDILRNTYKAIFLGEPENLNSVPTDEQANSSAYIAGTAATIGGTASYQFKFDFDMANLGKLVPFTTVSRSSGKFNSTQFQFVFGEKATPIPVFDVELLIGALPEAADVTILDEGVIKAARAAYDALSEESKNQVSNFEKLTAVEAAFGNLPEMSDAAKAVVTNIGELLTSYVDVTEQSAAAVAAARTAYDALDAQQKAYIDSDTYSMLARAEACVEFATNEGACEGPIVDAGIDTTQGPIIAASLSPRSGNAYLYLYVAAGTTVVKKSGAVGTPSTSMYPSKDNAKLVRYLFQVGTDDGQGRDFSIALKNGTVESDSILAKVPGVSGVLEKGEYSVVAKQVPASAMRKFGNVKVTSDGESMTATFTMPNTSYDKIFLGTATAAEVDASGALSPTGTEATSGTTGVGNVYSIPLESMYQPIVVSYHSAGKGTWTQETIEFVADDATQACIDAIAALNLNSYFNVTADQRSVVETASGLYANLTDVQKTLMSVSNYSVLQRVEAMFAIADTTAERISSMPAAESVTADDVDAVRAVKASFDGMGQSETIVAVISSGLQNSQIEKLIEQGLRDKLKACVAKADEIDHAAADPVVAAIDALPAVEAISAGDFGAIADARASYDVLTDSQKSLVANVAKLVAAEARQADLEAAATVIDLIAKLPAAAEVKASDYAAIKAARAAYSELTEAQQALVDNVDKLVAAESQVKETVELYPVNEEAMFKIVNAFIERNGDDVAFVFSMSGTSYKYMYNGLFADALANAGAFASAYGDNATSGNWVYYAEAEVESNYTDNAGKEVSEETASKYQFRFPVTDEATLSAIKAGTGSVRIPITAVSDKNAKAAIAGSGTWQQALYPRQGLVDLDAGRMVVSNFKDTVEASVSSELATMAVGASGEIYTLGTKWSNEFTCQPTFTSTDDYYDKAYIGTATDASQAAASSLIAISDGKTFTIPLHNGLNAAPQIDTETWQATVAFHVADTAPFAEAGTWVERTLTVNPDAKTIAVSGAELRIDFSKAVVTLSADSFTYNGADQRPTVAKVEIGGVELAADAYEVSYPEEGKSVDAGDYSVEVTPKDLAAYARTATAAYKIAPLVIEVPSAERNLVYTGGKLTGVKAGTGYTVTGNTGTDAKTYTATVTAAKNYELAGGKSSATVKWTIAPASIESKAVTLSWTSKTFNASVQKPSVSKVNGKSLKLDTDYTAKYSNASSKNAGSYTVTVTGKGNYTGKAKAATYTIAPISIANKTVTLAWTSKTFNSKVQKPAVSKVNGKSLKLDTDYTAKYSNASSKNAGSYTVTVTGKGNYTGKAKAATYKIAKATNTVKVTAKKQSVKFANAKKSNQTIKAASAFTVKSAQGAVSYAKNKADKNKTITVSSKGVVTVKKGTKKGAYNVKVDVTAAGNANYNKATKTVTLQVVVK